MKPKPIEIDNRIWSLDDDFFKEGGLIFIDGPGGSLSPNEARQLGEWLLKSVKWVTAKEDSWVKDE